jgi:hypothetical protein
MEYSLNGSEGFPTPAVLSSFADVNPDSFLVGLWECRYVGLIVLSFLSYRYML